MSNVNAPLAQVPIAPIRTPLHEVDRSQFALPALQRNKDSLDFSGVAPPWIGWFQAVTTRTNLLPAIYDTHAHRLANYPAANYTGLFFYETDRTVIYGSINGNWAYLTGTGFFTQAALPTDLGVNDAGFLAAVSDYGHILQWGGGGWGWGPGEGKNRKIELFTSNPGVGWHICDGSAVSYLISNGGTGTETVPNLVGNPSYMKATGAYGGGTINLAGIPQVPSENTGGPSATTVVQSGSGATVASSTHTHVVPAEATTTATDPVQNITMLAYYRQ